MSAAETLRQAAELMRERAACVSVAAPARWLFLVTEYDEGDLGGVVRGDIHATSYAVAESGYANDAEHIAAWDAPSAIAAADLLEALASFRAIEYVTTEGKGVVADSYRAALHLAKTYLGETP